MQQNSSKTIGNYSVGKINYYIQLLCYPLLILAALLTIFIAFHFHLEFSTCNIVFLCFTIAYLALMETLIPYEQAWQPHKKEWLRDGIYLIITMMGGGLAVAFVFFVASFFIKTHARFPLWFELSFGSLISSLGSYGFHLASHHIPWLWQLHGIHHVENKVNVGNNGVNHILDVFFRRVLAQMPMILMGISAEALFILGIFNTVQGYFAHANIKVRLGVFNAVLVSPEQHRLHHSKDLSEAGHYSVDITLWDLVFKTYTFKEGKKPRAIGVVEPEKFNSPDNIIQSVVPWKI